MGTLVGWIAERLVLWETTWAIEIVLRSEYGLLNDVWANLRWNGKSSICLVKATLELIVFIFFNSNSATSKKRGMKMIFQVSISLFKSLSCALIFAEEIIGSWSFELSNVLFYVFIFRSLLNRLCWLFVILCWLNSTLLFDWFLFLFLATFRLLLVENVAEDRIELLLRDRVQLLGSLN